MKRFTHGSAAAFNDLRTRAQIACIVFHDCEMPPSTTPPRGRIGFEIAPTGTATLMVDRGHTLAGVAPEVQQLFEVGLKEFASFDDLVTFMRGPLKAACETRAPATSTCQTAPLPAGPARLTADVDALTNMNTVNEQLATANLPRHVNRAALASYLKARIFGQDPAIDSVSTAIAAHTSRRTHRRPATLFLVGPTGVGKTQTALLLVEALKENGCEFGFLRLDMCEYQEAHRVSQLIGSPQGYLGYGDGAQLVKHLAENPRSIVVFDEIEKAHSDVFRTLMNAMASGRLSSAASIQGRHEIDCRLAVFVFTSNLGAAALLAKLAALTDTNESDAIDQACRTHLQEEGIPPEMIGRIGTFAVYCPLDPTHRARALVQAVARIAGDYGLEVVSVAPEAVVELLQRTNGRFGARPDEYVIERTLGEGFSTAAAEGARQIAIRHAPVRAEGLPPSACH